MSTVPELHGSPRPDLDDEADGVSLLEMAVPLVRHWRLLLLAPLLAGVLAYGASHLLAPTYTATTTFLPPQQQQSGASAALASLGALSGLAGLPAVKSSADQYVALLQSVSVADRLIRAFELREVYDVEYQAVARRALAQHVRIVVGKKDGLISVHVDDRSPERAALLANAHVDELRRLTSALSLTEAQQRRAFFEVQLQQTRDRLANAQRALEGSGFTAGALRAEPRAAADAYARLRAELTAAEVRLQTLRRGLTDGTPEVEQQQTLVAALRGQLARLEASSESSGNADYVGRYREFKYQETLFDLFARQYELARLDESREGTLIQVIDVAQPPERRSAPRRLMIAGSTALATAVLLVLALLARHAWHNTARSERNAGTIERLRSAWRRR